jgi:hypothetical protein
MTKSKDVADTPSADVGTVPKWLRRLRRLFKRSEFDLPNPETRDKSKYAEALFSILFYDEKRLTRIDDATRENFKFLVFRSLDTGERVHTDTYMEYLTQDWLTKGWVCQCKGGGVLTLTRDGTEKIIKLNAGWRGGYFIGDSPITEPSRQKFVARICQTVVIIVAIIAGTVIARDIIAIIAKVVSTYTDLAGVVKKAADFISGPY